MSLFLLLYIIVALCNYSIVQSYLGTYAGMIFSDLSKGQVKIGSLYVNPLGQVVLRDILMVSPTNDTVADGKRIAVRFNKNPISSTGLSFDVVTIKDTYYHLGIKESTRPGKKTEINLQWFIDIFAPEVPKEHHKPTKPFIVKVRQLYLDGVHYKMDLISHIDPYPHGVDIPHMEFMDIHARIKNIVVNSDNIDCRIVSFYAREKSGFVLQDLSTDVSISPSHIIATNMELQTDSTRLLCDAQLLYRDWKTMKYYCDSVYMTLLLKPGTIGGMSDAAYWAPVLWGVDERIAIEGNFYGPVANMHADNVIAKFGDNSRLSFDGHIVGLPNIKETYVNAQVHELFTTANDIASINLPEGVVKKGASLTKALNKMHLKANVNGSFEDCVADLEMKSDIGGIVANATIKYNQILKTYNYIANIHSPKLDLSRIAPNEWLTRSGLDLKLMGSGTDLNSLKADIEGQLIHPYVKHNKINSPTFVAKIENKQIEAEVGIEDSLAQIGIKAWINMADSIPNYRADINVNECNLSKLNIIDSSEADYVISTYASANITGKAFNSMSGKVNLNDTRFSIGKDSLRLNKLDIDILQNNGKKQISMLSDWLKLSINGYFEFPEMGLVARQFCDKYLPIYYNPYQGKGEVDYTPIADNYFNLDLRWIGAPDQLHPLFPKVTIAQGSSLHGSYNFTETLKLVARSDSLILGAITLRDLGLTGALLADNYQLNINSEWMGIGSVELFKRLKLEMLSNTETTTAGIKWGNKESDANYGDVALMMHSTLEKNHIAILRPYFNLADNKWMIDCPDGITLCDSTIEVKKLDIHGSNQSITLDASLAHKHNDQINIALDNIQLDRISRLLLPNFGMEIGGVLTAKGSMYGIYETPYLNANVKIDECSLGNQSLGLLDATTTWNAELNQLNLTLSTLLMREAGNREPLYADGYIELGDKNPSVDFDITFDKFDLNAIAPLATSFSSNIEGQVSGAVSMNGTFKQPQLEGGLFIENGSMIVNATGVEYLINDSLMIDQNHVILNQFAISDPQGNTAIVNGSIDCTDFTDIRTNLSMQTKNILVLNSKQSKSFYGKIFVSADATITGPFDALNINGNVKTNEGSSITVPINDNRRVKTQNYITFVSDRPTIETQNRKIEHTKSDSKMKINATVLLTPDLKVNLPMDFSQMFINIAASGDGQVRLAMHDGGAPTFVGDYEITSGTLSLQLLQLVTRKFTIEEGSIIQFPGAITDAQFDLKAIYSQRVNISSLSGGLSSSESSQKSVTVDDVFAISGTIDDPQISFDIRLPNADQSVQEEVFAYIRSRRPAAASRTPGLCWATGRTTT